MTTVINFFGAPSAGKSRTAARLFADMKDKSYDVELVPEYAKQLTWEDRQQCLKNQVAVFGRQYRMLCIPKTEYIITDSPIFLTLLYNQTYGKALNDLALQCFHEFRNVNFFLKLQKYVPKGRNQSKKEAENLEFQLKELLFWNDIPTIELEKYSLEIIEKYL